MMSNRFQSLRCGDGSSVSEEQYEDPATLNSDLVIKNQSIGVTSTSSGLGSLDGVLGVGPADLTLGTVSHTGEVPTVMDNLYTQGTIGSEVLGMFFAPPSSDDSSGELTFGGYDDSKITGDISYVPITSTNPASRSWGINQSISYGTTSILAETAGIVDTGSTFILIATGRFPI